MSERRRGVEDEEEEVSSFVLYVCAYIVLGRSIIRIEVSLIPNDLLHRFILPPHAFETL